MLNPTCRRYTYSNQGRKSRSRIDRIYVTNTESGKVTRHVFIDTPWKDHKIIALDINEPYERGPGQWALNNELLKDANFLREIEEQWLYFRQAKRKFSSILEWWDRAKELVKTIAIMFSIQKKRVSSELEKNLQNERLRLETLLDQNFSIQAEKELDCILKRQKELLLKKSEGHRIRARLPKFEENEPNISYYSRMEKIKSEGNSILSLYDQNGVLHSSTPKILDITKQYYDKLFQAGPTNRNLQNKILSKSNVRLTQEQKDFAEKHVDLSELENGMKNLPIGKSPGLDGLPVEFYRKMWPVIKEDFLEMVMEAQRLKILSVTQRKGIFKLVFKKEDRSDLKYYRPISLLNVDLKIITKTLAIRLGKILPAIINKDQTCIPGRNISTNLHTLHDIVKYANSRNLEAAVLFLDQEKAFDRVDHNFLLRTLKHMGFGDYFISWIKIFLKDISSQIKINGFLSEEVSITRGVRQGDPLSALLYVIIAEVLGNQIRSNNDIKGIVINDVEQKILQYADDTQIFLTNDTSITEVFRQLEYYEEATGAKVNIQKTEGLLMGKWKNRHDKPFDCKWTNDKVCALGLWIGNKDTSEITFVEQLAKIKRKGTFWKPRKISLIGRVQVVNTFLLSRLWYRTEIFSIPPPILKELDKYLLDFVWAGKKHEVHKDLLRADLEKGGLKLTNIQNKIAAQRMVWLTKLCNMEVLSFTRVIAEQLLGSFEGDYHGLDFIKINPGFFSLKTEDIFYDEVIKTTKKFEFDFTILSEAQLMEEHVFGNPKILDRNGMPYKPFKELTNLKIFRVRDLTFRKGEAGFNRKVFDAINEIKKHLPSLANQTYIGNAIPCTISLKKQWKPFPKIKLKDFYVELQAKEKLTKSYENKWETALNNKDIDWSQVWNNLHMTKISLQTKSAIYSQIHLGFFSEYISVKNGTLPFANCKLCGELITAHYHEILHCKILALALNHFMPLFNRLYQNPLTKSEQVFGIIASNKEEQLINFVVFTIRSVVHVNRGIDFQSLEAAKCKVINMSRQKISQEILYNFHLALEKGTVEAFCNDYLFENMLGSLENGTLTLNNILRN